jgi:hypothetical protein
LSKKNQSKIMRTHYDNLNVAESAPDEVIRAAYKALAKKFHPDRNNESAESRRIMQIINEAYEVLSNPLARREYDRILLASRQAQAQQQDTFKNHHPPPQSTPSPKRRNLIVGLLAFIFSDFRLALCFIGLCVWGGHVLTSETTPSRNYSTSSTTPSYVPQSYEPHAKPKYVRPSVSPLGTDWPSTAGYVLGYEIQAQGGLSSVRIDNTRNSSDVFVKLVWLSASESIPARMCYIPAYSSFTFTSVMVGRYDVRYRDLDTGELAKTEEFILEERQTHNGTSYSNLTLTLYKVANGNMTTEAIDESDF